MMRKIRIYIFFPALALLFAGCQRDAGVEETIMADQVLTAVAQTVDARFSLTPPATATYTPTLTQTPTSTGTPTLTATNSPTVVAGDGPRVTQANLCNSASFVSDVTIPDGTQFAPGAVFTKTWRLRNTGTCTWSTAYAVAYVSGAAMSGDSPQDLIEEVEPGDTVDVSVEMVAPTQTGSHTGYWRLQNASGTVFGDTFYVEIAVSGSARTLTPTQTVTTGPSATKTSTPTSISTSTSTATSTETPTETAATP